MEIFSPYALNIWSSLLVTTVVCYFIGSLLVPKNWSIQLKTASRFVVGFFFVISAVATIVLGLKTILFPVFVLLLGQAIRLIYQKSVSFKGHHVPTIVMLTVAGILLFFMNAGGNNLLTEGGVFVGNTDFSYYGNVASKLNLSSLESVANDPLLFAENYPIYYHFLDLWTSNFFSNWWGTLPYYAYGVAYGTMIMIALVAAFLCLLEVTQPEQKMDKASAFDLNCLPPFFSSLGEHHQPFSTMDNSTSTRGPFTLYGSGNICFSNSSLDD